MIIKQCLSKEGSVCFAFDDRDRRGTAEMVQLPWNNNGAGVWIQLTKVLTRRFFSNVVLTKFIAAVCEYVINRVTDISIRFLFKITYLHSRGKQLVWRVAIKLHKTMPQES